MVGDRFAHILLLAGVAAPVLFLLELHPASGSLGGLAFLLTGRALPTVFVGALAIGLAWLMPVPVLLRVATALILSFVFALNTSLPVLIRAFDYAPAVTAEVNGAVDWGRERSSGVIHVKQQPWAPIFARPFGPRVRVGGDEGCGCFYFLDAENALYSDRVIDTLFRVIGQRGSIVDYSKLRDPGGEARDVHIDLNFFRDDNGFRAVIDLYDHGRKIATFEHDGIPQQALTERAGIGRERLSVNFWENAIDLLLHDNVWNWMVNRMVPNYFPEHEFETFVRRAAQPSKTN